MAWEARADGSIPEPPSALILSGWVWTNEVEKHRAWRAFVEWGERYGFASLIPAEDEIPPESRQLGPLPESLESSGDTDE